MVKERIFFRVPRFVFFTTNLFLPRRRAPGMTLRWRIRSNKDMARPDASQKVWRSVVGVKENEGSIYQGAASCNESHLKKKSVSVSVSFFPPLVCMKIQSTNKVSAKKNQRIMAAKSRWKIAIFLTFRKVIPPKKTTSALTESLNQFFQDFGGILEVSWLTFLGEMFRKHKTKKNTMFFFPGQKCCCWMFSDGRIGGLKEMSSNRY